MILRHGIFLLILFLLLPSANAMENWELIAEDLQPVTVRMWKNPEGSRANEHISVETPKHYMSLRPISEKMEESKYVSFTNPCLATPNSAIDQLLQERKLNNGELLSEKTKTWPCDTFILRLNTASMDKMWEELLKDATRRDYDNVFIGKVLKNVHYVNEKMREEFDKYSKNNSRPYQPNTTLYFTNTSMAFGLLGKGGLFSKDVYYLESSKYFGSELMVPPLPFFQTSFTDAIGCNFYARAYDPSLDYIVGVLQNVLRRQELIRIHKSIERYEIPSLPSERRDIIIKMVDEKKNKKEIDEHLSDLNKIYHNQQSYLSPTGWTNTIFYKGEW
jgi:hypothetical protein